MLVFRAAFGSEEISTSGMGVQEALAASGQQEALDLM